MQGRGHTIALDPASQTQKKDSDGQWRAWCRVCKVWSNMAHVDSEAHHAAVSRWEAEEETAGPTTDGSSWSMRNFLLRKIEAEERKHEKGAPVRNISRRILMPEQVEDYYTWDIVEYLKEYAPPRFLDRHQLTGRIKMVQGRTNHAQLVRCVGLLYEAWREALQAIGALTDVTEEDKEKEEEEEDDDAEDFAERLARQLESFCVEPLDDLLEKEEGGASAAAVATRQCQ